jgi:hypothetical protein
MKSCPPKYRLRLPLLACLLLLGSFAAPPAFAQGCTQCRDNTAATPPATRRAYRRAIILMTVTGGGLFVASVALLRRNR